MDPVVKITPEALEQFQKQLALGERDPGMGPVGYRFGLTGGGCSGFTYYLGFEYDMPGLRDISWQEGGLIFMVDKKSAIYLSGSTVSWTKTLMKQGFEFDNPREASRCGCGHSITFK